jgi:transcription elongation factor S-II
MKIDNPKEFREKMRKSLFTILNNQKKTNNLEIGIYNYSIQKSSKQHIIKEWSNPYFVLIYIDRFRTIYNNIKNEEILKLLNDGTITCEQLAFMTHQELNPNKWDKFIEEKIKRDKVKYESKVEAMTDTFTCRKCKSKKCSYYQLQTRSSDEPMTTFVTCLDCSARWRS